MNRLRNPIAVILVLAVLIFAAGVIIDRDANEFTLQTAIGQTNDALEPSEDFLHLERANRAFIELVARTRPAIVQITTETERNKIETSQRQRIIPDEQRDRSREFFGEEWPFRFFFQEPPRMDPPRIIPEPTRGIGSGVIVSEDGYILTNAHVIDGADEITVTLANGQVYEAELIGSDPAHGTGGGSDLAVVKIKAEGLPTLPFGDSDALEVGEWVIAIGTPLNLSQTVTRGIVSAKGRNRVGNIPYSSFIQTDAPINRGNSGGALINIRGELVGINTLIATGGFSLGNIGLGFAIPSNTARHNLMQLIEHGEVERGWLGISMEPVDRDFAEKLKLDMPRGVLVEKVGMDSPAQKAGIQRGDVIISFDGQDIRDMMHLMHVVAAAPVGKTVEVVVLRKGGEEKRLTVKLGKRTEEARASLSSVMERDSQSTMERDSHSTDGVSFAGFRVQHLTPEIAKRYEYLPDEKGVIVTQVEPGSDAAKKGIVPGSLIQEMEWMPINDLETYSRLTEQLTATNKRRVLLYVRAPNGQRGGYVTIKVSTSDR